MPEFDLDSALECPDDGRPACSACGSSHLGVVDSFSWEGIGVVQARCRDCDYGVRQEFSYLLVALESDGQRLTGLPAEYRVLRVCPFCASGNLEVATFDPVWDSYRNLQRDAQNGCCCNQCNRQWWETYEYQGYARI